MDHPTEKIDLAAELQREWRESVKTSIKATEHKVDKLLESMAKLEGIYVKYPEFDEIDERLTKLEMERQRLIGIAIFFNAIGGVVLYLLAKFWK